MQCFKIEITTHGCVGMAHTHFKLRIVVIVGLNFLQKLGPKSKITKKEVFAENWIVPLSPIPLPFPSIPRTLQEIYHLHGGPLHAIEFDSHIYMDASSLWKHHKKSKTVNRNTHGNIMWPKWKYGRKRQKITFYIQ